MGLSFQELYKQARANAFKKPKKEVVKIAKEKKEQPVDYVKKAKNIVKARKEKRLADDDEPKIDYAPRSRSSAREKPFPNRPLNLEAKIKVQVDSKTWVYVDPDADIEAVKEKYRKRPLIKDKDDLPAKYQF